MAIPYLDINEVALFFSINALVLLVTAELVSPYYEFYNLTISWRKLKRAATTVGMVFFIVIMIRILLFLMTKLMPIP